MRNISDERCRENGNTQFMFIFFFENCAILEIMWKNKVQPDRTQITTQYGAEKIRFACRITKVIIQTHTQNM